MQSARNVTIPPRTLVVAILAIVGCLAPATADDGSTFKERSDYFIRQTAAIDPAALQRYFEQTPYFRRGSGDPHKYALPPIMARLYLDRHDPAALALYRFLMSDSDSLKSDRGLYHFSIFQKTRLYFQDGGLLPEEMRMALREDVRTHFDVMVGERSRNPWTENHNFMQRCSAYLWAEELSTPGHPHPQLAFLRRWLVEEARKFYTVGMGEYDSSTYLGFSAASWANVYDFAKDEEIRLVARAALDWMATALALKYYQGVQLGPESRGFAREPVGQVSGRPGQAGAGHLAYRAVGSHSDWCGWLWWGGTSGTMDLTRKDAQVDRFPALNLALSTYRPHAAIRNLARKRVALPFVSKGSKPTYYRDADNQDHEVLWIGEAAAMGTLYSGQRGLRTRGTILPQTTMFKLLVRDSADVHVFGMAQGYHGHYPLEGRGPFDQYHQAGRAAILLTDVADWVRVPDFPDGGAIGNLDPQAILGVPHSASSGAVDGVWRVWSLGSVFVGARALGERPAYANLTERLGKQDAHRWLVSKGRRSGWIIQIGDRSRFGSAQAFTRALNQVRRVEKLAGGWHVRYVTLDGDTLRVRHTGVGNDPEVWTNGKRILLDGWPVYDSPYVKQAVGSGILEVTDGQARLRIDFRGRRPVYEGTRP